MMAAVGVELLVVAWTLVRSGRSPDGTGTVAYGWMRAWNVRLATVTGLLFTLLALIVLWAEDVTAFLVLVGVGAAGTFELAVWDFLSPHARAVHFSPFVFPVTM